MTQKSFPIAAEFVAAANITAEQYAEEYKQSIASPEATDAFWAKRAELIDWIKKPTKISDVSYDLEDFRIKWYEDGELNISVNCLDRHVKNNPYKPAIIWEGDHPSLHKIISFKELHSAVCRLGNAMRKLGVKKGDRVTLYMPMVPEAVVAMLACTRIGAVHSVVFGGFSAESLGNRIIDSQSKLVITADEGIRGNKRTPLKANVDRALDMDGTDSVTNVIVVHRTGNSVPMSGRRDVWYHSLVDGESQHCEPEVMNAEDPLFLLYTSGSTGKPKGVLHTTGGYITYALSTFRDVFDIKDDDVYWCTADVGWVTGHTYATYAPLANGTTTVMFEGVPEYPTWARIGHIIDKHQITILYTAPTAIRAMMKEGDTFVRESDRSSLRLLGTVGEPINPEAWDWYYHLVGGGKCPIVDTWWQTETGGIMLSPIPGTVALKPGAAMNPLYGIIPEVIDTDGTALEGSAEGNLVINSSWPGQMRTIYNDHKRFLKTYFTEYPGYYFTGDGVQRDEDGHYWITGRVDDVLNVSGHRLGTAEIESAVVAHPATAEAAVVGMPHDIRGTGLCAFIILKSSETATDSLKAELNRHVRSEIGPIANLDAIYMVNVLPKTRSGKIMRRILRSLAAGQYVGLGDLSTLADSSVINELVEVVKTERAK
ncbi:MULTISPECIES: acetate--CoA ligase [unclassified Psychrobacter]|uniref:acetate--CoA ligase n=1 Tax=unclassified Psychrobacter TaxID=196806 RepID=UPI000B7F0327|nr:MULTISPECIES: acetate--CoA ligase [unclassified Psychrobacter]MDE4454421.1 acetate--CoA ligase [Psychrobacter sp. DAB_AL62B]OXL24601.1 acetate--CoA ligase [Psychrobacter sp. DAB_AL32B]